MKIKKIVKIMKGMTPRNFKTNSLGTDYVDITYGARGKFGQLLKLRRKIRVNLPKNVKISSIENHKPKVGMVTITYNKNK